LKGAVPFDWIGFFEHYSFFPLMFSSHVASWVGHQNIQPIGLEFIWK